MSDILEFQEGVFSEMSGVITLGSDPHVGIATEKQLDPRSDKGSVRSLNNKIPAGTKQLAEKTKSSFGWSWQMFNNFTAGYDIIRGSRRQVLSPFLPIIALVQIQSVMP